MSEQKKINKTERIINDLHRANSHSAIKIIKIHNARSFTYINT